MYCVQDTVSVCRPSFYAQRFQNFMAKTVFRKIPSRKFRYFCSNTGFGNKTLRIQFEYILNMN